MMSHAGKTAFWDGLRLWVAAMAFFLVLMSGCAAPKSVGWHPKSEKALKMLIGQTVMEALHQYQTQLWKNGVQVPKAGSHMNKEISPAREQPPEQDGKDNRV